jgi:hypothetical protein
VPLLGEDDKVRVWDISSNKKELEISTSKKYKKIGVQFAEKIY